jgi:hypothetical protein
MIPPLDWIAALDRHPELHPNAETVQTARSLPPDVSFASGMASMSKYMTDKPPKRHLPMGQSKWRGLLRSSCGGLSEGLSNSPLRISVPGDCQDFQNTTNLA